MLSFVFENLVWLGLPIVGLPVLIHLINMMRHRRVPWAAMEFLLVSQKKNRAWILFKQILLLLLRMAAVAGVVLLAGGPHLRNQVGSLFGSSTTHHVVLVDDSFSMSDRWGNTSAFEEAKKVVQQIGKDIGHEGVQTFTLLRFSRAGQSPRGMQPDLIQDPVDRDFLRQLDDGSFAGRLADKLASWTPSQTDAGPTAALEAVGQILGNSDGGERIVYLVSDFRARQWDNPADLKKHLRALNDSNAKLFLVNCVETTHPNLAIMDLAPGPGTRAAGVPLFMEVTVRNFGAAPARDVAVLIEADGHAQPSVTVAEIPPGKAVQERFPVRFPTAGAHRITARLEADAVAADNFRYAVVEFPPDVPVLLIEGDPETRDGHYLAAALDPGPPVVTGIRSRIEPPRFLAVNPLDSFRAIYLLNVDRLDKPAVAALDHYVAAGGGLGIFAGERCRPEFYNQELYREGHGPFPIPLDHPAALLIDRLQRVPDVDVAQQPVHRIFKVFEGARNSFLPLVIVDRYFAAPKAWKPEVDSGAAIIAKLRNGAPFTVEKQYGEGRVVAFLSTVAPTWNNWARENPSFPVAMQELQAFLSSQPARDVPHLVGAPWEVTLDAVRYEPQIQFTTPREDEVPTPLTEAVLSPAGKLSASLAGTDVAGIYAAHLTRKDGTKETRQWACNVEAEEGDLRAMSGQELASRLEGVSYRYFPAAAFQYDSQEQEGYNLSGILLYVLIFLLIVEQILAWSASYHPPGRARLGSAGGAR